MKKLTSIVLGLLLFFSFVDSYAEGEKDIPSWIKGTLFVSTLGSDNLDQSNPFGLNKYVCLYDFEGEAFSTIQVPRDTHLTRDLGGENQPVLISHATSDYSEDRGWGSSGKWKGFFVASYIDDPDSKYAGSFCYGVSENPIYVQDGVNHFTAYSECMTFDAPVQILEIQSPEYCIYYLEYGVSDDSELEIRFVCENSTEKVIIDRYPINYQWGKWVYAISPNGNVAYKDAITNQIAIVVGEKRVYIPESEYACQAAWRNDQELLLFTYSDLQEDKCELISYNIDLDASESMLDATGAPICIENAYLYDMDINQKLDCLAFCYVLDPNADREVWIEMISLKDKMRFAWEMYPLEGSRTEDVQTITGDVLTMKSRFAYGISDDGVCIFEPSDRTNFELTWYSN